MLSVLIKYLIAKLETFEYLDKVYGLATTVQVGDETMPAVYSGNELTHINFDSYDSLIYIQQNGKVGRETNEHPAVACKYNVVERYPLRLIVYSQGKETINCESYSQQISDSIKAALNGKQQTLETAANLTNATIILGDTDSDKNSVWQSQFSAPNQLTDKDILISIDLEFEIEGDDTCFANNPCEKSEFVFDLDSQTFCERVDDCLNIPQEDGNYMLKILDGVKSWVAASASAAWGSITGTITDQTDLVNYITTRLTGYATELFVTSQGYITNVVSALGYTPEDVANKATDFSTVNNTLYPSVEAVKNYTDALIANFPTIIAKSVSNYSHTGDTNETKVHSVLIPANTFAVGDIFRMVVRFTKTGTANTWRQRVRIGTADDLTGVVIRESGVIGAAVRYASATKLGFFKATNNFEIYATNGISDEGVQTSTPDVITTFDPTVNNYLVFSVELVSGSADTAILSGYYLLKI